MSMTDLDRAIAIIATDPARGTFAGPRDPALIAAAERALGGDLPSTYRVFVEKLGAGSFGGFEIYGVIDEEFQDSSVPNGVWLTLNERQHGGLPHELVVIGSTGDGDYYCLRLGGDEDSPVVIYQLGSPPNRQLLQVAAADFGEFFLNGVSAEL